MALLQTAQSAPWLPHAILLTWLSVCSVQDLRRLEVSNWLTLPPFVLGLLYALSRGREVLGLTLVMLVVFLGARAIWKAQGAADIKVLVVLSAFWPSALFAALIATAVWSIVQILRGKGKEAYSGLPPITVGALLVLVLLDLLPQAGI